MKSYLKLRFRMMEVGFQNEDLARVLGKSGTYVVSRLGAKAPFTLDDVYTIGRELEIPPAELLDYFPPREGELAQKKKYPDRARAYKKEKEQV